MYYLRDKFKGLNRTEENQIRLELFDSVDLFCDIRVFILLLRIYQPILIFTSSLKFPLVNFE